MQKDVCNFLSNKSVEILFESESFWIGKCREKKIYSECVLLSKRWYTLVVQMKQQARSVVVVRLLAPLQQFAVSNSLCPIFSSQMFLQRILTAGTQRTTIVGVLLYKVKKRGCFCRKNITCTRHWQWALATLALPRRQQIHPHTGNMTVFAHLHKFNDQKHIFCKIVHQTDRRAQVVRLLMYLTPLFSIGDKQGEHFLESG